MTEKATAIPKLRQGSYFPSLLEPRRAERALLSVVQEAYVQGVSTRKVDEVDELVKQVGMEGISRSAAHEGLQRAIAEVLTGVSWQRCRVPFLRNLLQQVPKHAQSWVMDLIRTVFAQPTPERAYQQLDEVADQLEARFPKAAALPREADVTAIYASTWDCNLRRLTHDDYRAATGFVHDLAAQFCAIEGLDFQAEMEDSRLITE